MNTTMIGVKEAVQAAISYLQELQSVVLSSQPVQELRLEEVELSEPSSNQTVSHWLITLSYTVREDPLGMHLSRKYKIFTIDAATGKVQSMKIREL
jgi:hypothetical protein